MTGVVFDKPPPPKRPPIEPFTQIQGAYVGIHRHALISGGRPRTWHPLSGTVTRIEGGPDLHYDEDGYLVEMRFHRPGRGGKPFEATLYEPRIPPIGEFGMTDTALEAAFSKSELVVRYANDPEFGDLKIYSTKGMDFEFEQVGGKWILSGAVLTLIE